MEAYFSTFDIPIEFLSKELTVFYDELGNIKDVVPDIVKKECLGQRFKTYLGTILTDKTFDLTIKMIDDYVIYEYKHFRGFTPPDSSGGGSGNKGTNYIKNTLNFTESMWNSIFPYSVVSSVWTKDNTPYWNYNNLIDAIDFLENHHNPKFKGFASSSSDLLINKIELCAFLANMQQEVGEPALIVPSNFNLCNSTNSCMKEAWCNDSDSPCSADCNQTCKMSTAYGGKCECNSGYEWNDAAKKCTKGGIKPDDTIVCNKNKLCNGSAGGAIQLLEGALVSGITILTSATPPSSEHIYSFPDSLNINDCKITAKSPVISKGNQSSFGLPNSGAIVGPNAASISSDGTLYIGITDYSTITKSRFWNSSWNKQHNYNECSNDKTSKKCVCLSDDIFCQYGGRGAIQLSYNYNYTQCSLDLFGDFRLVVWPNLIIGIHNGGTAIEIPDEVLKDTPDSKTLGWLTCFWFWMTNNSGYLFSCHDAIQKGYGITCANLIINNQSGCDIGTWASYKNEYFKRICTAFDISDKDIKNNIICNPDKRCKKK